MQLLDDNYAAVRYQAGKTLKALPGFETFPYDYVSPDAVRAERRLQADKLWQEQMGSRLDRHGPGVLLDAQDRAMTDEIQRLRDGRDHRPIALRQLESRPLIES